MDLGPRHDGAVAGWPLAMLISPINAFWFATRPQGSLTST